MDRYWLLTWTTYGTWLPGAVRGSVTSVHEGPEPRIEHERPGTDYDGPLPGLHAAACGALKGPPLYLTVEHAAVLLAQFRETAAYRRWWLGAVAVMANHIHLVVGVPGDPDPETLVRDFKAYGSRALNRCWPKPVNGTWWTGGGGSRRKLPAATAVAGAVDYVKNRQPYPLLTWAPEDALGEPGASAPGESVQSPKPSSGG